MSVDILVDGERVALTLTRSGDTVTARVGEASYRGVVHHRGDTWHLDLEGCSVMATVVRERDEIWVALDGEIYRCTPASEDRNDRGAGPGRSPRITAPLPGKVLDGAVREGQQVAAGDSLVVLEAMKMETVATTDAAGIVTKIHVTPGTMVDVGQLLVDLELAD